LAAGPSFSVIIIPLVGREALANCLDRLPLTNIECIVVFRDDMGALTHWERRYPSVKFIGSANEPVPLRRQRGLRFATGDVVGLIEDTSWPNEGWCAAAFAAFAEAPTAVAGGPVKISATLPYRYRALGISEYRAFALTCCPEAATSNTIPDRPIATSRVPGNNMAFRRIDLIEQMGEQAGGLFEGSICTAMLARGHRVVYHPRMQVTYAVCDRHNASLVTRYHHGRIYAGQARGRTWSSRLAHLAKTPLLPFVLTARAMASLKGSIGAEETLPILFWLFLMESAWAVGEAIGALSGVGSSINYWR